MKGVFLTWNDSRRSMSLARELHLPREVRCADRRGITRHVLASLQTAVFLVRSRPTLVWYQFSFLLGVLLAGYALIRGNRRVTLVADLHTKALRREGPGMIAPLVRLVKGWALRACRLTLVTNSENADLARLRYGVVSLSLPDPIPFPPVALCAPRSAADVVFVCSFAVDEPLDLLRSVAERLHPWRVAVTGDPQVLKPAARAALGDVATLTGFLPESGYWALLNGARCIVVLSTTPGCIPCGAYEALAVGCRPVVAFDTDVQMVLGDKALYAPLETSALCDVIDRAARTEARDSGLAMRYQDSWVGRWATVLDALAPEDEGLLPRPEASHVTT